VERFTQFSAALASVRDQTLQADEIVVVVDGDPILADMVHEHFPEQVVLLQPERWGLSSARMRGVHAVTSEFVAFLDDDAVADPNWLEGLRSHLDDPAVLGVSGASLPKWEADRPAWFPDEFLWVVGCSYRGLPTKSAEVRNVFGGCCMYRRSELLEVGGYDPTYGYRPGHQAGGEEAELALRLRTARPGGRFVYEPSAVIRHRIPASRLTVAYLARRCRDEGIAKAAVARRHRGHDPLDSEREFALALPAAMLRYTFTAPRPEGWVPARALGIVVGASATLAGLAQGRLKPTQSAAAPPRGLVESQEE
jgi:glycosyltransferase involved in cell wall biosynthesis